MKNKGRKFIALILALVLSSSAIFVGCNNTKNSESSNIEKSTQAETSFSQSAEDYEEITVGVTKNDNQYTVTLSDKNNSFSEKISKNEIWLKAGYSEPEKENADKESSEVSDKQSDTRKEESVKDFEFKRESAGKITVTFKSDKDFTSILAGIDKTATTNGKYGDGMWSKTEETQATATAVEEKAETPTGASILADSYSFDNGNLSFKVQLGGMTFTVDKDGLLKAISSDFDLTVKEVEKDSATMTVKVDAKDLDSAIKAMGAKTFTIKNSAFSDDEDVEVIFKDIEAKVNFDIDTVEENADKSYTATARLFTVYGKFEELSKDDISFGGDFNGAKVTELKKSDSAYDVSFTFQKPYNGFSLEDCALDGTVTVADGKIKNDWGTNGKNSYEFTFTNSEPDKNKMEDIADVISSQLHFICNKESTIVSIGKLINLSPQVSLGITGAKLALKVAGILGIKEIAGEDSGYTTDQRVKDIQDQMKEIDSKISRMNDMISTGFGDISTQIDWNTYTNVCYYWNNYISTYVGGLQNVMSSFKNSYNSSTIKSILSPSNNTIKIYIDNNGDICIPGLTEKYSSEGVKIKRILNCKFDESFAKYLAGIMLNNRKTALIKDSDEKLSNAIKKYLDSGKAVLVDAKTNTVPKSLKDYNADALFTAVTGSFALDAIEHVGAEKIVNTYTAFCYRLGGGSDTAPSTATGKTYLDYFYQMISLYYNFYSEAESDINTTKAWLATIADQAYPIAVFAQTYYSSDEKTVATATEAFEKTIRKEAPGEGVELPTQRFYTIKDGEFVKDSSTKEIKTTTFVTGQYSFVINDVMKSNLIRANDSRFVPTSIVNDQKLRIVYNRYLNLKKAGLTSADTFTEYILELFHTYGGYKTDIHYNLVSGHEDGYYQDINLPVNHTRILTSIPYREDFPTDNTVKLRCFYNYVYPLNDHYFGGDYFGIGKDKLAGGEFYIGNGKKCSAKYFKEHFKDSATLFNTDDGSIKTEDIYFYAHYMEDHWYWRGIEHAKFYSEPLGRGFIYFTQG